MAIASSEIEITRYVHCPDCLAAWTKEGAGGESMARRESRRPVGGTTVGIQVWCNVHNRNVAHIHFEGARHPVNINAAAQPLRRTHRV